MNTYDVIIWQGTLSDGSTCYAAWCSCVLGVGAQGRTEAEALASITAMMADTVTEPWEVAPSLADAREAAAELTDLMRELAEAGIPYRVHPVTLDLPKLAGV